MPKAYGPCRPIVALDLHVRFGSANRRACGELSSGLQGQACDHLIESFASVKSGPGLLARTFFQQLSCLSIG